MAVSLCRLSGCQAHEQQLPQQGLHRCLCRLPYQPAGESQQPSVQGLSCSNLEAKEARMHSNAQLAACDASGCIILAHERSVVVMPIVGANTFITLALCWVRYGKRFATELRRCYDSSRHCIATSRALGLRGLTVTNTMSAPCRALCTSSLLSWAACCIAQSMHT